MFSPFNFFFPPGGHFLCKTFDLFTPFSIGLVYLLYCCFERVSIFKPVTSRPANSERWEVRNVKAINLLEWGNSVKRFDVVAILICVLCLVLAVNFPFLESEKEKELYKIVGGKQGPLDKFFFYLPPDYVWSFFFCFFNIYINHLGNVWIGYNSLILVTLKYEWDKATIIYN